MLVKGQIATKIQSMGDSNILYFFENSFKETNGINNLKDDKRFNNDQIGLGFPNLLVHYWPFSLAINLNVQRLWYIFQLNKPYETYVWLLSFTENSFIKVFYTPVSFFFFLFLLPTEHLLFGYAFGILNLTYPKWNC